MKTKSELLIDCIGRAKMAYTALETAKADCDAVVDSEIDQLVAACEEKITAVDKKNIKKIAKAAATGKFVPLVNEAKSLSIMALEMMGLAEVSPEMKAEESAL